MGEMGEIFKEYREIKKAERVERANKFIPLLIKLGAEEKSDGVWQIGEYFCYPTKGFAMHKKTYKKCGLSKHLEKIFKQGFTPIQSEFTCSNPA